MQTGATETAAMTSAEGKVQEKNSKGCEVRENTIRIKIYGNKGITQPYLFLLIDVLSEDFLF